MLFASLLIVWLHIADTADIVYHLNPSGSIYPQWQLNHGRSKKSFLEAQIAPGHWMLHDFKIGSDMELNVDNLLKSVRTQQLRDMIQHNCITGNGGSATYEVTQKHGGHLYLEFSIK